jgi:enediyne biosynthesis protein E4
LADFNLDGLLDWVVVNRRSNIEVYENVTTGTGHWIGLKLQQPGINPDAVGAWIEVRVGEEIHTREVTVGGGHAGGVLTAEHFGLGKQKSGSVRIIWPDGITSEWKNLPVDRYLTVLRKANGLELTPY